MKPPTLAQVDNIVAKALRRLVDSTSSLSIDSFTDAVPNTLILAILGNLEDARKALAAREYLKRERR